VTWQSVSNLRDPFKNRHTGSFTKPTSILCASSLCVNYLKLTRSQTVLLTCQQLQQPGHSSKAQSQVYTTLNAHCALITHIKFPFRRFTMQMSQRVLYTVSNNQPSSLDVIYPAVSSSNTRPINQLYRRVQLSPETASETVFEPQQAAAAVVDGQHIGQSEQAGQQLLQSLRSASRTMLIVYWCDDTHTCRSTHIKYKAPEWSSP
jgi:hypothetical protein